MSDKQKNTNEQREAHKFYVQNAISMRSKRGLFSRQKIAERDPGLSSVGLFTGQVDAPDNAVPAAAWTDGKNVYYAKTFEYFSKDEQVGVEIHEELHIFLRHVQRGMQLIQRHGKDFDATLWNIALDAIINTTIEMSPGYGEWFRLPMKGLVLLPELLKQSFDEEWSKEEAIKYWEAERLYYALKDNNPHKKDCKGKSGGNGSAGKDNKKAASRAKEYADNQKWTGDIAPPENFDQAQEEREASEWIGLLSRARMAGMGSGGVLRQIGADFPESKTPWQSILCSKVASAVIRSSEESYAIPARSYLSLSQDEDIIEAEYDIPYMPGISNNAPVARIGVAMDSSGSIGPEISNKFYGELRRIQRLTGAEMVIVVADDRIHREYTISPEDSDDVIGKIEFAGCGGTDFSPALKRLDDLKVGCIVYLTDLEGPADYRPKNLKQVIWAVPAQFKTSAAPPFGQKLILE